ncbi:MAG: efflux RND transporter periplasmic adaptor subunit [Desulfovibrionaceae bacterium]
MSCLLTACSSDSSTPKGRAAAPVTVSVVQQHDMERKLHVVGNVLPSATVGIKTRVTGELLQVHFTEGDEVKAGQTLFTIDQRPYAASLREAEARIAKTSAQLRKAEEDMKRYSKLVNDGYISREAFDQAVTDAAALRATISADKASAESAALQLAYCTITAPLNGRAGAIKADKGNMIKANADDSILTIDALEPVYVLFAVPESHLPVITERQKQEPITVRVTPTGGKTTEGLLTFIENTVDTRTGTIKMRGTFKNTDRSLWPGQFVQVIMTLGTVNNAIIVPSRSVQIGRAESYVYVVDADKKAQYRKVVVALDSEGQSVISEGLKPGEMVVEDGQVRLAPGIPVEIRKTEGK